MKFFSIFLCFSLLILGFQSKADGNIRVFIQENNKLISKSSSKTVGPVLKEIKKFDQDDIIKFLNLWKTKKLYLIKKSGAIVYVIKEGDYYSAFDIFNNEKIAEFDKKEIKNIKPNSGVRSKIDASLVEYQIFNSNIEIRKKAIGYLNKNVEKSHLKLLRQASDTEVNKSLKEKILKILKFAILEFSEDHNEKIKIIESFSRDTSLEVRASLNKLLKTSDIKIRKNKKLDINEARIIIPEKTFRNNDGTAGKISSYQNNKPELSIYEAYDLLHKNNFEKERVTKAIIKKRLIENVKDGKVGPYKIEQLNNDKNRLEAYKHLSNLGLVKPYISIKEIENTLDQFVFYSQYIETSKEVTNAAKSTLDEIKTRVNLYRYFDLFIDGLSLSSIYFLGAIGLAITFGVMRVINMAHGEFIMMGAYTGYVVQTIVPNHTLSILIALPLAFIITFIAGVLMERLVIKHLYKNPLDTLLATFGVSIALQQITKNIFGTQARPLTSPSWLEGSVTINDDLSISVIRIAIFFLGIAFLFLMLFIMNRTRLGLEIRAVTQNPTMASNMGINPNKINMLTFGFGSAIAGIAGVAIGLFSKVTSELGSEYIVQSFMTVVVGGVGNIWGTLAGASLIGFLQKLIEWFNPSNTLAAQTYMIIFIILFIQFRPKGIFALKGRVSNE